MAKLPLHARVALKNGVDDVYIFALAGTEGWVRSTKVDPDGFDLVKVEWDKDHWRYNGQPDGWTFAEHFSVIGPPEPPTEEETEDEGEPLALLPPSEDEADEYMEMLTEAMDSGSESEGFLMITIRRVPNPENPAELRFVPQIYTSSTSKEAELLLDIQLAECAASSYQEMVFHLMRNMKGEIDDDE